MHLAANAPFRLTPGIVRGTDVVVALGCEPTGMEPSARRIDWQTPNSRDATIERMRAWRDEVCTRIRSLLKDEGIEDPRSR